MIVHETPSPFYSPLVTTHITVRTWYQAAGEWKSLGKFSKVNATLEETIGILDPFQVWSDERSQCLVCGQPNSRSQAADDQLCRSESCHESVFHLSDYAGYAADKE